jgi:D-arabinose 1-dehydrogenase-like Zn-dependent alcohol dehydrogenase
VSALGPHGGGWLALEDLPESAAGEVLFEVKLAGICGPDLHLADAIEMLLAV